MGRLTRKPPNTPPSERPLLALAMIVRNEEANLRACLASARDLVDEIVVVDTGSTDRTLEIAAEFGARIGQFTWVDDFAAARNAALDLVTARWVLHLDADEELEAAPALRMKLERVPDTTWAIEVPVVSISAPGERRRDLASFQKRLFRSSADIRFERPIHEEIVNEGGGIRSRWTNLTVWHSGYIDERVRHDKIETRNRPILERAYAADPTNPVYGLQLAILQRDAASALALYARVRDGADRTTRRSELFHMATVRVVERLREAGRVADAINLATEVFVDDPTPDITVLIGQALVMVGELERAAAVLKLGLTLPADTTSRFITGSASWLPLLALGEIGRRQGRFAEAASYVKKAIALHPEPELIMPRLAVFYAMAKQWPQAAALLGNRRITDNGEILALAARRAFDANDLDAAIDAATAAQKLRRTPADAILLADAFARLDDNASALRVLKETVSEHPDSFDGWIRIARLDAGPTGAAAALDAIRRATELEPASADAWALRGDLELGIRDNERAAESTARALELDPAHGQAALVRTKALARLGRFQEAYDLVHGFASRDQATTRYTRALSDLLDQAGEPDEALAILSAGLDAHPNDHELYTHLGGLLGRLGRYEDALNAFELALDRGAKPQVLHEAMKLVSQAARRAGVEVMSPVRAIFQS